jgi:hypothetical protein
MPVGSACRSVTGELILPEYAGAPGAQRLERGWERQVLITPGAGIEHIR